MNVFNYSAPAALYLGSTTQNAEAQGPRLFRSAAGALRFALEQAAPVSLRGARIETAGKSVPGSRFRWLYNSPDFPAEHRPDQDRLAA
jgi:hypothetical protein